MAHLAAQLSALRRAIGNSAAADGVGQAMTPDDSRRISLLLGLLFGLAGLGSASAAIAVPLVADHFDVSVGVGTWMISVYVLMLGVATAVYGRVSDLIGPRIPFLVGIALMTIGAIAAAVAPSFADPAAGPDPAGCRRGRHPRAGGGHHQCPLRRRHPRPRARPARRDGRLRDLPRSALRRSARGGRRVARRDGAAGARSRRRAVRLARPRRRGVARPTRRLRRAAGGGHRGRPDPGDPVALERPGRGPGGHRPARARHARRGLAGTPPAARLPAPLGHQQPRRRPQRPGRRRDPGRLVRPAGRRTRRARRATAGSPTRSVCCSCRAPRSRCSCRG